MQSGVEWPTWTRLDKAAPLLAVGTAQTYDELSGTLVHLQRLGLMGDGADHRGNEDHTSGRCRWRSIHQTDPGRGRLPRRAVCAASHRRASMKTMTADTGTSTADRRPGP